MSNVGRSFYLSSEVAISSTVSLELKRAKCSTSCLHLSYKAIHSCTLD